MNKMLKWRWTSGERKGDLPDARDLLFHDQIRQSVTMPRYEEAVNDGLLHLKEEEEVRKWVYDWNSQVYRFRNPEKTIPKHLLPESFTISTSLFLLLYAKFPPHV